MSAQTIIVIVAIVVIIVLAAGSMRRGPRVTQIDRVVRKDEDSDDA